jgi:hypothetical protein
MKNSPDVPKETDVEVEGIVVPDSWTKESRVKTIVIQMPGEQEYLIIARHKMGKDLKKQIGRRVQIKGNFSSRRTSPKRLIVKAYKVLEW